MMVIPAYRQAGTFGYSLIFGHPARSPTSRSLAEGRRSGEGRCLEIDDQGLELINAFQME